MNKLKLMQITGFEKADTAIPESWLNEMENAGFKKSDLLYSIAFSDKKPIILPLELINKMSDTYISTNITTTDRDVPCEMQGTTLLDALEMILEEPERFEIISKNRKTFQVHKRRR
jgi:hypothetical protein